MNVRSQYMAIEKEVANLLNNKEFSYKPCVRKLEGLISNTFRSLNSATNPVVINLSNWEEEDLKYLIQEYSGFSNESIHMFHDANIRLKWDGVKTEIEHNVSEEMGLLTQNIPHLELMRHGYRKDLGVETDNVEYSAPTANFIRKMTAIFRSANNAFICGALLAFEATATFEFKAVELVLRTLKKLQGGEIDPKSLTGIYIAGHVSDAELGSNPEDKHYDGMCTSIEKYITVENSEKFILGFVAVCMALNIWWEQLTEEVYAHRFARLILCNTQVNSSTSFSVSQIDLITN